jgi:hypothetical protein
MNRNVIRPQAARITDIIERRERPDLIEHIRTPTKSPGLFATEVRVYDDPVESRHINAATEYRWFLRTQGFIAGIALCCTALAWWFV